jgi:large subunit ribosomal protein L1
MGSTKIKTTPKAAQAEETKPVKATKVVKKTKKEKSIELKETKKVEAAENPVEATETKPAKKARSRHYQALRSQVDKTKVYPLTQAIELVKKLSSGKLPQVTADVNYKDTSFSAAVQFPYSTGKSLRVAIADDEIITRIEAGKLDFDILISTPQMMPRLVKYARVLGPKGLMPNPKNQTVTPDPEKKKKELEGGRITIKTEKKAPLVHVLIGKTSQPDNELVDNLKALIKVLNPHKIQRLTISSTMSPGVKVDFMAELAQ